MELLYNLAGFTLCGVDPSQEFTRNIVALVIPTVMVAVLWLIMVGKPNVYKRRLVIVSVITWFVVYFLSSIQLGTAFC